jgi:aminopeptidase
LRFRGPGTDLTVGLADGHAWCGGAAPAKNGIVCNPNIPTEEVFTTPHKDRVDGMVASTKPLSYMGTLIRDIRVRFESGRIVEATASAGEEVLRKVLDTDEGARRLGEVALVPYSSPISQSGLLFFNTLFDENAASHIALGQAYSECFVDGGKLGKDELAARGANTSLIHIDWMIGSAEVDVDGVTADGGAEPLMRRGDWVS